MSNDLIVDLDTLMDFRMGYLIQKHGDNLLEVINKNYLTRLSDYFIEGEIEYTRELIKNSVVTPIIDFINEHTTSIHLKGENDPFYKIPAIKLNTYPLKFSEEEISLFEQILSTKILHYSKIEIVSLSNTELSPEYLNSNVSILIKYNYMDWLEKNSVNENLNKLTCPNVTMIGPMIHFKHGETTETTIREIEEKYDLPYFQIVEMCVEPFINLKLLPVNHFSVNIFTDES